MLPTIEILGRSVGMYALCGVVGLAAAIAVAIAKGKPFGFSYEDIFLLAVYIAGGMLVGGHLLYGVTRFRVLLLLFRKIPDGLSKTWFLTLSECFGGSVFYGGWIGAALAVRLFLRLHPTAQADALHDLFGLCVPLFHCFGRIGCFFGGCCYGKESPFGFTVHGNRFVPELNGVRRFPVALVESVLNLLIFMLLLYFFNRPKYRGTLVYRYAVFYPPIRFILEFFRGDSVRGFVFGLSISQWISILLLIWGTVHLYHSRSNRIPSDSPRTPS